MASIADLIQKLEAHPERQKSVPIEAADSYPFLTMRGKRLCVTQFCYVVIGPPEERTEAPPRWIASAAIATGEVVEFRALRKADLAFEVPGFDDDDLPVNIDRGVAGYSYEERVRKVEQLHEALESLASAFPKPVSELTAAQKRVAGNYLRRLKELVSDPWKGYYLALGKDFFVWLMQASGAKLMEPPAGAPAAPPRPVEMA